RVVPERVAKPEGAIYNEFVAAFSNPRLGAVMFRLVAEKLASAPTLTYDEPYTSRQRDLARSRVRDVYDTYRRGDILVDQDQKIEDRQLGLLGLAHST